jgi:hypothetical protein
MPDPTADELRAEIATLERKIAASTGSDGNPLGGYRARVEALRERTRAQTEQLLAVLNAPVGSDSQGS